MASQNFSGTAPQATELPYLQYSGQSGATYLPYQPGPPQVATQQLNQQIPSQRSSTQFSRHDPFRQPLLPSLVVPAPIQGETISSKLPRFLNHLLNIQYFNSGHECLYLSLLIDMNISIGLKRNSIPFI